MADETEQQKERVQIVVLCNISNSLIYVQHNLRF